MPHTVITIPENLRSKAHERGWPDDLIEQALVFGATPDQIIGYMDQGVTVEQARNFLAAATRGAEPSAEIVTAAEDERPQLEEKFAVATFNGHRLATVLHDARTSDIVVFCHGFHGHKGGPNGRFFVRAARTLASHGISSLRFDQYGCGDSEGDSTDSSFRDWITTTRAVAEQYVASGYRVALFGHSMGAVAALGVAAELRGLAAVVAWSGDPNVEPFVPSPTGFVEEGGQLARDSYWREAHEARIAEQLERIEAPTYLLFGTADHLVDAANRKALVERAGPRHRVEVFDGYGHSAFTVAHANEILARTCAFLVEAFKR